MVSGAVAGPTATILCQPFDVVKTQMIGKNRATSSNSAFSIAKNLYNSEGISSFWRGSVPTLFRVLPGAAINFGMIHTLKTLLSKDTDSKLSNTQNFIVGGISRGTSTVLLCPITVVKTRFEFAKIAPDASVVGTLKNILQFEGRRGLYSGLSATLARDIPYSGLYFVLYSKFKTLFSKQLYMLETDTAVTLSSGAVAAVIATLVTHPFEVVRTRTQLETQFSGVLSPMKQILQTEGALTLFRGVLPRMLKRSASSSLAWTIYETTVKLIQGEQFTPTVVAKFEL